MRLLLLISSSEASLYARSAAPTAAGDEWAGWSDKGPNSEANRQPKREVSAGEAYERSLLHGYTMGGSPAIAGLSDAGGTARTRAEVEADPQGLNLGDLASPIAGLAKLIQGNPEAKDAYNRGRERVLNDEQLAKEQHGGEDRAKLLEALKDNPEINETIQRIANAAAAKKIALPGCRIVESRKAA